MNILHIKYAIEVEKMGSISKAAENLFMNQPQLSKAIRELEETIGITIFKRSSKGVVPTTRGAEFINEAKGIIAQINRLETNYNPHKRDSLELDAVVPRSAAISDAFASLISQIGEDENLHFNYRETNPIRIIKNVSTGESNFGIVRCDTENEKYFLGLMEERELKYKIINEFKKVVLVSQKSPIAGLQNIDESMLDDLTQIEYGDDVLPFQNNIKSKDFINKAKKRSLCVYERAGLYDVLRQNPNTYAFVAPADEKFFNLQELVVVTLAQEYWCKDIFICRNGYKTNKTESEFIEKLKN